VESAAEARQANKPETHKLITAVNTEIRQKIKRILKKCRQPSSGASVKE
jgi:hypothetical protein